MRRVLFVSGLVAALATPVPVAAWGFDAHKFIVERAVPLLPPAIRPLFEANRSVFAEHAIDPDLWRVFFDDAEDSNHYLDLDWPGYGPYPFANLPREYDEAVKRFGKAQVDRNGRLPWRVEELYGRLTEAFASYERRGSFGRFDILHTAAWLAHYVSDAHVPHHAVVDADGRAAGQRGIHVRFEALLFERYVRQLRVRPPAMAPIATPRDFVFDTLRAGTQLVPAVLEADRAAIGDRDVYDDAYFAAFFKAGRGVLEQRLGESVAAVAAVIAGAWEAAGRPAVPVRARDLPLRRRPAVESR